jgi:hypothetical protein
MYVAARYKELQPHRELAHWREEFQSVQDKFRKASVCEDFQLQIASSGTTAAPYVVRPSDNPETVSIAAASLLQDRMLYS